MDREMTSKTLARAVAYLGQLEKGLADLPLDCKMKMPAECHAAIYQAIGAMGEALKDVTRNLATLKLCEGCEGCGEEYYDDGGGTCSRPCRYCQHGTWLLHKSIGVCANCGGEGSIKCEMHGTNGHGSDVVECAECGGTGIEQKEQPK